MGAESNAEQLFRRLDQLKAEKGTLGIQARHFIQVAQSLKDPLNWRIGGESVIGYGNNVADVNLPDVLDLADRVQRVQREHHDLTVNASVHLEGTAKKFFLQELEGMRRRFIGEEEEAQVA